MKRISLYRALCLLLLLTLTGCGGGSGKKNASKSTVGIQGTVTLIGDSTLVGSSSVGLERNSILRSNTLVRAALMTEEIISDQLIIAFKPSMDRTRVTTFLAQYGLTIIEELPEFNAYKIQITEPSRCQELIEELKKQKEIEFVEVNRRVTRPMGFPNDPEFNKQWGLQAVDLPNAWELVEYGAKVRIAVIDGGFFRHADLKYNEALGYDFFDDDPDPFETVVDYRIAHGTHVAGIIGAIGNNNIGTTGVCWGINYEIIPIKIFGVVRGELSSADSFRIAKAIQHAVNKGAHIINMSWGGSYDRLIEQALQKAYDQGVTLVAAAGNTGQGFSELIYPARLDFVIAVGATNSHNERSGFSLPGTSYRNVDLMAPGEWILSTVGTNGYEYWSGTSMAAPYVTGLAALLHASGITAPRAIKDYLVNSAKDIGSPGVDRNTGYGVIDSFKTVGLTKVQILLIDQTTNTIIKTVKPNPGGNYYLTDIPHGNYKIGAWVDVNKNNLLDTADFYGETQTTFSFTGETVSVPSIIVERYSGGGSLVGFVHR
ncbi:MAG TPA: S8 family serine peptidase [Bacillota bacterium]|nr:S8 family serine peptidase [Bacillota bacterium]HOL09185.1 S8 family serine peptidase [Bacillota bacterium]HPO96860.1 S8 family serine peptidase [Bacillota bacterium]